MAAPLRPLPDTALREIVARHNLDLELAHARLRLAPPVDGGGGRLMVIVIPGALGAFGRDGCGGSYTRRGLGRLRGGATAAGTCSPQEGGRENGRSCCG